MKKTLNKLLTFFVLIFVVVDVLGTKEAPDSESASEEAPKPEAKEVSKPEAKEASNPNAKTATGGKEAPNGEARATNPSGTFVPDNKYLDIRSDKERTLWDTLGCPSNAAKVKGRFGRAFRGAKNLASAAINKVNPLKSKKPDDKPPSMEVALEEAVKAYPENKIKENKSKFFQFGDDKTDKKAKNDETERLMNTLEMLGYTVDEFILKFCKFDANDWEILRAKLIPADKTQEQIDEERKKMAKAVWKDGPAGLDKKNDTTYYTTYLSFFTAFIGIIFLTSFMVMV
mmetsp:Transcript_87265/g.106994  ORF Transcript_87265/g.106994 Transcript_87265/m.106994 type:complete len:286 (-) Transcript_87265:876-1733(-)